MKLQTTNPSAWFIHHPIATFLLTLSLMLLGLLAWRFIAIAPLPQVDFPVISVQASLPGASPEVVASSLATPLERNLGQIAGVNEMTSISMQGSTTINLQFDLNRNIDGAARDIQAAILATRNQLPSGLREMPSYKKINPADAPIMVLALTSDHLSRTQLYDAASTLLAQRLAQTEGIGKVVIGGGASPAIRVSVNRQLLNNTGLNLEDVRVKVQEANQTIPLGILQNQTQQWTIDSDNHLSTVSAYQQLILRHQNHNALKLQDIAQIESSVQDEYTYGASNGKPAILIILYRQPSANIIATVDRVNAKLAVLASSLPAGTNLKAVMDRTPTIRSALAEVELTLAVSIALVVLIVLLFLKHWQLTLIPTLSIPVALLATIAVIYLLGFSLNNISLMALIVAAGFVVDDSIVVLENILRHHEKGTTPLSASLVGSREVVFTVIAISLSLVAVFMPIILMDGIVGRLFQEFAVTLAVAVLISMVISLTTTPSLAAHILKKGTYPRLQKQRQKSGYKRIYQRSLAWSLRHPVWISLGLLLVIIINIYAYIQIDKGFFPNQDTGRMLGRITADQDISFSAMQEKLHSYMDMIQQDPEVEYVNAYMGFGSSNTAVMFISLKNKPIRQHSVEEIITRLRPQASKIPGSQLYLIPIQDLRLGGRSSSASYQLSILADNLADLAIANEQIKTALSELSELEDVSSEQQDRGHRFLIEVDRARLSQAKLTMHDVDSALNNAYAQRLISTIYHPLNQYRVVLETSKRDRQQVTSLNEIILINSEGKPVPLNTIAQIEQKPAPLTISHDGGFPAATISFNLANGIKLSQGLQAIEQRLSQTPLPEHTHYELAGNAKAFKQNANKQPLLILAAIFSLYVILGILYESLLHPLTILSTLPSAGLGALIALSMLDMPLDIIGLIGVFLLIGLVKKNAILMIDFAIDKQRSGLSPAQAIFLAAQVRFRPILMTTLAALLGAVPLAIGLGDGAELRVPLGITIIGGLIVSQLLTLYTTPVIYLALESAKSKLTVSKKVVHHVSTSHLA